MYATGIYTSTGYACDYAGAMKRANREHQTRFGQLCRQYGKKTSDPMIRELMEPEHCPFYEWNGRGKEIAPKPPGVRTKEKKPAVRNYVPPVSEAELQEAYDQGLSDTRIAQLLKITWHQVARWRHERGLESNFTIRKREKGINDERAMKLYTEGLTDAAVAEALHVNATAVFAWRTKKGLQANGRAKLRGRQDRMMEMYRAGCSDMEIAIEVGATKGAVTWWRNKNGLEANFKPGERRREKT